MAVTPATTFQRSPRDEDRLLAAITRNEGIDPAVTRSISQYAAARTRPGPVVLDDGRDLLVEAAEELADARNYLVWALQAAERRFLDADSDAATAAALDDYHRIADALTGVLHAWAALGPTSNPDGEDL